MKLWEGPACGLEHEVGLSTGQLSQGPSQSVTSHPHLLFPTQNFANATTPKEGGL